MSQPLVGFVVSIQQNHVHVIEPRELACDGAAALSLLEPDLLTFCERHGWKRSFALVTRQ